MYYFINIFKISFVFYFSRQNRKQRRVSTISFSLHCSFFFSFVISPRKLIKKKWVRTHGSLFSRPSRNYQIASKLIYPISSASKILIVRHPQSKTPSHWTLPHQSRPIVPVFRNFPSRSRYELSFHLILFQLVFGFPL